MKPVRYIVRRRRRPRGYVAAVTRDWVVFSMRRSEARRFTKEKYVRRLAEELNAEVEPEGRRIG